MSSEDQATTDNCNCDYPMAHCKEHDPTPWTRAGYPAETIDETEMLAREYVRSLVAAGKAEDLMDAYSEHNQTCHYIYGIVLMCADGEEMSPLVRNFCKNLLDDWSK